MELAEVCNRLLRFGRVTFLEVDRAFIDVRIGCHDYHIWVDSDGPVVLELIEGDVTDQTPHSEWVQAILEGKVRNDAGEMVERAKHYTY